MFSVVIPTYNNADVITDTLHHVNSLSSKKFTTEIIVVDDCSTDNTFDTVQNLTSDIPSLRVFRLSENEGPGIARNKGIDEAKGEWILFLDSDDSFATEALVLIYRCIQQLENKADLINFDWRYDQKSSSPIAGFEGRDDLDLLSKNNKQDIVTEYLLNRIDNSVIYTAFHRNFLLQQSIQFRAGLHEDVDFMFKSLLLADEIASLHLPVYIKNNRINSIVNTFDSAHIDGYFGGLEVIFEILAQEKLFEENLSSFISSITNITSSRILRLWKTDVGVKHFYSLLTQLYNEVLNLFTKIGAPYVPVKSDVIFRTKYQHIFDFFMETMSESEDNLVLLLSQYLDEIDSKSWSCYDLHNSVFLAPGEVRTCCKRFFYEGKMKGDVVLLDKENTPTHPNFSYQDIADAKTTLHKEINRDNAEACRGCSFLQFSDWGPPLNTGVKYLSLEYHSVCNMKCTYCSEVYYGGKKAQYDINAIVSSIVHSKAMEQCEYIVWGGGEPTLDKTFTPILTEIAENIPGVKQRVITNATRFIPELAELMRQDKAYIVTSIDAGTQETFNEVRKYNRLGKVMSIVERYAEISPHNVIVKYIFLPNNRDIKELVAFVELVKKYHLIGCNFQISFDFTEETTTQNDLDSVAILYGLLLEIAVRFIFLDDLILQRLASLSEKQLEKLQLVLASHGLSNVLAEKPKDNKVIVWGTGAQTHLIIEKCHFFKGLDIDCFLDPREEHVGTVFMGRDVLHPSVLKERKLPVVIAAVQSAPHIYTQYLGMGLPESGVIKQLIL